ncbi:hypothetical protein AAEU42_10190 [Pseudoflavonifractor phocaeensis]|uniref:hypothetical protein n=1 Tax=Pseudoflavonifractor phocaeensis TaxID=1870988 RepID=UPI00313D8CCA
MNLPFKFPVSLEEFMAYQANLVGRKLPRSTKNLVGKWLPTINNAYEAGLKSDFADIKLSMDFVDGLIESNLGKQAYVGFMEGIRCWIAIAWDHGQRDAGKKAEK